MNATEKAGKILKAIEDGAKKHGVCVQDFGKARVQYTMSGNVAKLRFNGKPSTYDFVWRTISLWCKANEEQSTKALEGIQWMSE